MSADALTDHQLRAVPACASAQPARAPVLIHDHHESYLGRLPGNEASWPLIAPTLASRPPREGPALCQGITTSGSCGDRCAPTTTEQRPSYECSRRADGLTTRPADPSPRPPCGLLIFRDSPATPSPAPFRCHLCSGLAPTTAAERPPTLDTDGQPGVMIRATHHPDNYRISFRQGG
jgi:hypothetical protein